MVHTPISIEKATILNDSITRMEGLESRVSIVEQTKTNSQTDLLIQKIKQSVFLITQFLT